MSPPSAARSAAVGCGLSPPRFQGCSDALFGCDNERGTDLAPILDQFAATVTACASTDNGYRRAAHEVQRHGRSAGASTSPALVIVRQRIPGCDAGGARESVVDAAMVRTHSSRSRRSQT